VSAAPQQQGGEGERQRAGGRGPEADAATIASHYRSVLLIRRVEKEIVRIYPSDKIKSPVHLSIGQEAVAVAVCQQLTHDDVLFATYRSHATYLAKGGDLQAMWAELYGRAGGCARGKAGSMHLVDTAVNVMGTSAIVASGISNAVGYALGMQMQGRPGVVVCFFGEGATDEGAFHESINFAALRRLPVLFVCENNGYAIYSPVADRMAGDLLLRIESYDVPAAAVSDGDIFSMREAAGRALAVVRAGEGPFFLEITTMRWLDHVGPLGDLHHAYRSAEALVAAQEADQLMRLAGLLDPAVREAIDAEVERDIAAAIAFAEASPLPASEEVYDDVYAQ
jgi:pyruvate dehydrogenase E1 component alpha subunit